MKGAQAVALRVSGDKSAFYNCRILGFQDTLLDDQGRHFFKDCYVEGTVDFIFGDAKSIYLVSSFIFKHAFFQIQMNLLYVSSILLSHFRCLIFFFSKKKVLIVRIRKYM